MDAIFFKKINILLLSILAINLSAQTPRINFRQVIKDTLTGSVVLSGSDSNMVYSRDFFLNLTDSVLILFGDTLSTTATVNLASEVTGTLPVANGGTGATSFTAGRVLFGNGTSAINESANLTFNNNSLFVQNIRINKGNLNNDASIAIGYQALDSTTTGAEQNMAIGYQSQFNLLTGAYNVSQGFQALYFNKSSNFNAAFGYRSLFQTTGERNTGVASETLYSNTSGSSNVGIGYQAGYYNTSGDYNIFIGNRAGWASPQGNSNTTGDYNIFIGNQSIGASATDSNQIVIGYQAIGLGSNIAIIGNSSLTDIYNGADNANFSTVSDARDKKNIQPLELGLNLIKKLNPVAFVWDKRDSTRVGIKDIGFIAQEFDAALYLLPHSDYAHFVKITEDGSWKLNLSDIYPVIVKAIQEQQAIIESQATEIEQLKSQIQLILSEIEQIKNN